MKLLESPLLGVGLVVGAFGLAVLAGAVGVEVITRYCRRHL